MTSTDSSTGSSTSRTLREEDLVPGKPFTHPETRLEYADFHAYFRGEDPLYHWRNNQIQYRRRREGNFAGWTAAQIEASIEAIIDYRDRDGQLFYTSRPTSRGAYTGY